MKILLTILNVFFRVHCVFNCLQSTTQAFFHFGFLMHWRWSSAKKSRRNRSRTANINQYTQFMTNYNKHITVLTCVEGVCHHLWLHHPLTGASPFLNYYNSFQVSTPLSWDKNRGRLQLRFKNHGVHTLRLRKNQKKIYFTHRKRKQYSPVYLCFNNVLASKHYRLRDSRLVECMDCDCKRFYFTFFAFRGL